MGEEILENAKVICDPVAQDLANQTNLDSATFYDASAYDRVVAIASCEAPATAADTVTVYILEAEDSSGTNKAAVSGANATDTMASATDTGEVAVECRTEALGSVGNFVGMRIYQDNNDTDAKMVAGVILLADAKERPVTQTF